MSQIKCSLTFGSVVCHTSCQRQTSNALKVKQQIDGKEIHTSFTCLHRKKTTQNKKEDIFEPVKDVLVKSSVTNKIYRKSTIQVQTQCVPKFIRKRVQSNSIQLDIILTYMLIYRVYYTLTHRIRCRLVQLDLLSVRGS